MSVLNRQVEPVVAANRTTTGEIVSGAGRLRGLYIRDTGMAGTVTIRDGGASGTTILVINTPGRVGAEIFPVPAGGIAFLTDLHVTLSNVDGVTAFYVIGE